MSVHVASWAWRQKVGDAGAKLVLIKLAEQANDRGECWPSQRKLAEECEMGRRTVQRKLEILYVAGLVEAVPRARDDGGDTSLLYRLGIREVVEVAEETPVRQIDAPPCVSGDVPRASAVAHHEPSLEPTSPAEAGDGDAPSAPLEQAEIWVILEERFGRVAPRTNAAARRNRAAADLRKLGATAASLRHALDSWGRHFGGATLTDIAIATHFPQLTVGSEGHAEPRRPAGTPCPECEVGGGSHAEGCSLAPPALDPLDDARVQHLLPSVESMAHAAGGDRAAIAVALRPTLARFPDHHRRALLDRVDELRGETPGQAYRRWVIEKAVDREFPLEEIASIVSEWRDLDDVGRQELLDLATSTRERALLPYRLGDDLGAVAR